MSKNPGHTLPYSVSQNFLTSQKTLSRLLGKASLSPTDTVVEIGAGKGHITRALSSRCGQVISYEIDRRLWERLAGSLPGNVRLLCGDFLKAPLPQGPYKVFANIPFSRTTEILRRLTYAPNPPQAAWLILEWGAAKRFCGQPQETLASLALKPFFQLQIRCTIPREEFHPAPRVDAALLELRLRPQPQLSLSQRAAFAAFVSHHRQYGFFHTRALLTRRQVSTALRLAGLPQIERSGNMLYVQWLCLFRCWQQFGQKQK
ncbi:MAG: 23S ribosomal RNA methyltransferase Erm [Oscillospiraceae bacterium]|nr:23S ribosomal RNA methyltransferase Erm [Oscillospiraceae bacterium]